MSYRYSADIVQIQCTYSTDTDSTDSADAVQMQYRFIHRCIHSWNTHETAIIEGVVALN